MFALRRRAGEAVDVGGRRRSVVLGCIGFFSCVGGCHAGGRRCGTLLAHGGVGFGSLTQLRDEVVDAERGGGGATGSGACGHGGAGVGWGARRRRASRARGLRLRASHPCPEARHSRKRWGWWRRTCRCAWDQGCEACGYACCRRCLVARPWEAAMADSQRLCVCVLHVRTTRFCAFQTSCFCWGVDKDAGSVTMRRRCLGASERSRR
ncbi:hypothetical protein L1887_48209 [Cichorium endivia]|nr:hypothetical protein L1887_48209 [Cichorium endivia]